MELVLASRNAHKALEFEGLITGASVLPLPAGVELPPETGNTFAENALVKAQTAASATGRPAIADDSGIAAGALGGAPGVRSARFAGENATDEENLALLRARVPPGSPLAYHCAIAFCGPDEEFVVEARCTGTMATEPRGDGGFGYDPVFVCDDDPDGRTMAELSSAEKAAISHRGRAARLLGERLAR
ncbi:MAG: non-canonical purine NTP pyrophosphatase [Baekduia sp.]